MRTREIITLQIGPFSNWAGAHFWNIQDEACGPPALDEAGDPIVHDEDADADVLYRSTRSGRTPRLVLCDSSDAFGSLNMEGAIGGASVMDDPAAPIDPLAWGGGVAAVAQEPRAAHPFVQMLGAPALVNEWDSGAGAAAVAEWGAAASERPRSARRSGGDDDYDMDDEDDDEYDEDDDDDEYDPSGRRRTKTGRLAKQLASWGMSEPPTADEPEARAAGEARGEARGEEGAEEGAELTAAAFRFEESVEAWSDYLQAQLHSRSLGALKPHAHGYSTLTRFPDGECIVSKEEDTADGPGLVEKVRRCLEEADSVGGFHLLLDADGGFGGAASALLTQIRDDYSHAPCLALGLGTLNRPKGAESASAAAPAAAPTVERALGDGLGAHGYAPALNDAMSLTAFAELKTAYMPVYGSAALRSALTSFGEAAGRPSSANSSFYSGGPTVTAPPLLTPTAQLRYHSAAPLAAFLDAATLPYRARSPRANLHALVCSLSPRGGMHLACGALAMPIPSAADATPQQGWFSPLCPLQRMPDAARAYEQHVTWLGHLGGARAVAPMLREILPCRSDGGALWVRQAQLRLPLSFPQFYSSAIGRKGEVLGAPSARIGRGFTPELPPVLKGTERPEGLEVLELPVASALQSTPGCSPMIRRVCADWAAERRAAERAAQAEGWGARDELSELTEQLTALREAYGEGEDDQSATSGWSSGGY